MKIESPMKTLGGLRSEEYLALNPQGKMPLLTTEAGPIAESDVIVRYLLDKYSEFGPSLIGATLEERTRAESISRHHDMYITTIQGCMYKPVPPFASFGTRTAALKELRKQLDVLETLTSDSGPYLAGPDPTFADAAVFPTMIFCMHSLPKVRPNSTRHPNRHPYRHPLASTGTLPSTGTSTAFSTPPS